MDERHWWFASKLQETFHFGGYDNPTLLEDFLSEPDVVELINKFLSPGEPHKLFFYCDATPPSSHCSPVPPGHGGEVQSPSGPSRQLHTVSHLTKDVLAQGCVCLYVLRKSIETEVDSSSMEKELYCGELRHSVLSNMATLLAEAYNPILHAQRNWKECSDETISNFLQCFSKISSSLSDSALKAEVYQPILQRPSHELRSFLVHGQDLQYRGPGVGSRFEDVIAECEALVVDWVGTVESLLIDATDERLEDANGTLMSELSKWQRRQTLISAIVEQLKTKECKMILATLAASKSRVMKKWRTTDLQITDAFNNVRDRVRYLEALSPHLEALEGMAHPSPSQVMSIILPSLVTSMKQMEGVSRVYARSGYLGTLCIKLSNSLVRLCVSDLDMYCSNAHHQFWSMVSEAIQYKAQPPPSKPGTGTPVGCGFIGKLESYLQLRANFRDFLSQVRDALLTQHVNFSHLSSNKKGSGARKPSTQGVKTVSMELGAPASGSNLLGVPLQNTEKIMLGIDNFASLVSSVLELVSTLGQFTRINLEQRIKGLPRFAGLWKLECLAGLEDEGEEEEDSLGQSFNQSDGASLRTATVPGDGSVSDITLATPDYLDMLISRNVLLQQQSAGAGGGVGDGGDAARKSVLHSGALSTLKEESWVGSVQSEEEQKPQVTIAGDGTASSILSSTTPSSLSQSTQSSNFPSSNSAADSLGVMIQVSVKTIRVRLELGCGGGVEDVFGTGGGKSGANFSRIYQEYTTQVAHLDANICSYLKVVFSKMMPSSRALDLISRFGPIASRPAIKEALERCMLVAFSRYALELEQVQDIYERNKGCPELCRNAPPVARAVQWARHLLKRVEGPMEVFRNNVTVMDSVDSLNACKLHNRLATTLVKYESLWLDQWRTGVMSGRGGLKAPLLVQESHLEDSVIKVNCKQEMLELLAESKALVRLGIAIPQAAQAALNQELRVKQFKQKLEYVLEDYYSTKSSLDPAVAPLMGAHIEAVVRTFLPGWTTLTWSTMNIDAFLHRAEGSVEGFKAMVTGVMGVLKEKVYGSLDTIGKMSLFDVDFAASRMWQPQQLVEIMMSSVIERSNKLLHLISNIRSALYEIVSITAPSGSVRLQETAELQSLLRLPLKPRNPADSSGSSTADRRSNSNKSTPQRSGYASGVQSAQQISSAGTIVWPSTPTHEHMGQLGPVVESVILHFCELTFDEVNKMVLASHDQFVSTLWSKFVQHSSSAMLGDDGEGEGEKKASRVVSFNVPDSPEKADSLAEVLKQDGGELQAKMGSITAALSSSRRVHRILQLVVDIKFSIPRVVLEPSLDEVYAQLMDISSALLDVLRHVRWWLGPSAGKNLYDMLELNGVVKSMQSGILQAVQGVSPSIEDCLQSLRLYDFLWQQDIHSSYQHFLASQPQLDNCSTNVQKFMELEGKIETIPSIFSVGPLQLSAKPVKNSLRSLAVSWKMEFTNFIHQQAKSSLDSLVSQCADMVSQLHIPVPVEGLSQLRDTLRLLHQITDMQNFIDDKYLPVEKQYAMLRVFNPHLPRNEIQKVDALREEWAALIDLAEEVKTQLLSKQRVFFEREVDKQVKAFVVETIQFRNSFDTEGPLVPGLLPNEAVTRLGIFLDSCEELKGQRDLLGSVQKLLDIPRTPYPELDQTERDISYLRALYSNYQQFLNFDKRFRQVLWNEVDLESAEKEMTGFWRAYQSLPAEQQEWDAARKLCLEIGQYLEILPLLRQLHSREIRNRHWLQVMGVVNCTFQLEGSIFKMAHLLDAGLLHHVGAIQEIVHCAQLELQLEEKFFSIEEEWSEQNLHFEQYKSHGPVLLDTDHTYSLLEQLEHAQMQLATMLMSKYIQPLKEEAIQWAAKLATLSDILQLWLLVQRLWTNLEAVFNTPKTVHEFSGEAIKFASIHKRWIKLMKKAHGVKNILHCCFGSGEGSQSITLSEIKRELEECKKSLSTYLQSKREVFPRFFFVSDDSLLSILSDPTSVVSIQPHLISLFGAMNNIVLAPSVGKEDPVITAVESVEGERLDLISRVPLSSGVEQWAEQLLCSVHSTLQHHITSLTCGSGGSAFSLEDTVRSQVAQVASMAVFFQWCHECEQALLQCRYDRRALPSARAKFNTWSVGRLAVLLVRSVWKGPGSEEAITCHQRASLEALAMLSLWLRDVLDDLCHRKLKDMADFEWQRYIRPYLASPPPEEASTPREDTRGSTVVLQCLDQQVEYGFEYLGCTSLPVFTPRANNYIIAFTQARSQNFGNLVTGPAGSGKVQLVKGIAQICGRNLLTLRCSPLMHGAVIMRTLEGVAREGVWACFSNVQSLPPPSFSVLSQMMQIIRTSLQAKRDTFTLSSTKKVALQSDLTVFLTSTPATPTSPHWTPPTSLSPILRTFSFSLPDATMVIRAHCTALGFKAPRALANKLATLREAANKQLSAQCPPAHLSIPSICHILKVASHLLMASKATPTSDALKQSPERISSLLASEMRQPSFVDHSPTHHEIKSTRKKGAPAAVNLSPTAGQPLPPYVMREHTFVAQIALNIIGARLPNQELVLFTGMVKEAFAGHPSTHHIQLQYGMSDLAIRGSAKTPTSSRHFKMTASQVDRSEQLRDEAMKAGFVPSLAWLGKVEQLHLLAQLKHAVIIAGKPATGKTTALRTVVATFNNADQENSATSVKLTRVFPQALEEFSDIFGCVNSATGDWEDGIFTSIFRKAHKATQSATWLCLDSSSMDHAWVQYLPELFGKNKTLTLSNGEHLLMDDTSFKLVFETGSLEQASPAALLNSGIVYFDSAVLGWRPVVGKWLTDREDQEGKCLLKYFEQIMDSVVEFVLHKSGLSTKYSEVGLLETCLAYLTTLLKSYSETAEVFSEIHIERLLLFSVIWSYGSVLEGTKDQLKFSHLLKTLTNSLPDDDSQSLVFDYYVDESGEWDVWQSRVPLDPELQVDMLGSVYVNTVDSIRVEVLLELALAARRHVLLVGPHGCGKTTICRHVLQSRALSFGSSEVFKQLVMNGHTQSDAMRDFMGINFHHRQGYTYGPKHGKLLECFVDDLHLPLRHSTSANCSSHEYLRQLMDLRGMYGLQRKNEWSIVEDFVFFGALTSNTDALVSPRLRRHFAVVPLAAPGGGNLKAIMSQQLQGLLDAHSYDMVDKSYGGILEASLQLYSSVKETLKVSDTPGRQHYFFSLKNLVSVFQGLCQCISSGLVDNLSGSWVHEVRRAFCDGICRNKDSDWLHMYAQSLGEEKIASVCLVDEDGDSLGYQEPSILSALSPEVNQANEPAYTVPSPLNTLPEVCLVRLKQSNDLHLSAAHYLRRYREEHGENFELDISENNLSCLVKLHRALYFPIGNSVLVGSLGQQLVSLASFALFLAGYEIQSVDFSKESAFIDGMKSLFRQAGLEGKPIGVIIKESDLGAVWVSQALNSIISSGELPTLFTEDELDGLLQALGPSIKRDFPSEETDPMQYFVARLFRNLRFIFCLSPSSPLLGSESHDFKGLWQSVHLIWLRDWTVESSMNATGHFFDSNPLTIDISDTIRSSLMKCLSSIHYFVMQETQQLLQAGMQPGHLIQPPQLNTNVTPSIRDELTTSSESADNIKEVPEQPFTYDILMEKIKKVNRSLMGVQEDVYLPYVGPRTYQQFLECFCEIFLAKQAEAAMDKENLSKAVATLGSTEKQAEEMKTALKELRHQHSEASRLSEKLMKALTLKSCQLEKLKALMGQSSSVLNAMQMVKEQERQLVENDEDEEELLMLFLDRQTTRLEALLVDAREHVRTAEQVENEAKQAMMKSKEAALHWQGKIDRNAIDQVKSLNNPPQLVGIIMELMLTLLQQYGADPHNGSVSDGSSSSTPGHVPFPTSKKRKFSTATDTAKQEKEQWNAIVIAIGDSQRFLDLLNGLKWEDGLSTDAVNLVLSKLAIPGKNIPVTGLEGSINGGHVDPKGQAAAVEGLITESMALHAAESAANMFRFAASIVEYNDSFKPYKIAAEQLLQVQQRLTELEAQANDSSSKLPPSHLPKAEAPNLEGVSEEVELGEEGLLRLQGEVDELQESFDKAVIKKHSLAQTCQEVAEKLKSANHLLESLKSCQESWQRKLDTLPGIELLMANCILAAAITVYCGSLRTLTRHKFFDNLQSTCRQHGFPTAVHEVDKVLKLDAFPQFMLGVPMLHKLVIEKLPPDSTSQQNAAIIMYPHSRTWHLILDSLGIAEEWLKGRENEAKIVQYQDPNVHDTLFKAIEEGSTVLIGNVDVTRLDSDSMLLDILQCRRSLYRAKNIVKNLIGGREVECSPNFCLYLVSPDPISAVPPRIASLVCMVVFYPELAGLQESILDSFLQLQNQKTFQDRAQLRAEIHSQSLKLEEVERGMLEALVRQESGGLDDPKAAKHILSLNKSYEDAMESLTKAKTSYSLMNEVHLSMLRGLASQASVIMGTVCAMAAILPSYYTSYANMLSVFLTFIEQAGSRIQGEDALVKMTTTAYSYFVKEYFEKDRLLFSFMLSEEIEINQGRATREEQSFLVSPLAGQHFIVKGLIAQSSQGLIAQSNQGTEPGGPPATVIQFGKKTFDWMTDSQWQLLLMLASQFPWVHPILERQGRDGKDALWRTIGEGIAPETITLTESLGYKLLPMQQLLLLVAMRPERATQSMSMFVSAILGKGQRQKKTMYPTDLTKVAKTMCPTQIPMVLFRENPELAVSKLQQFTTKARIPLTTCCIHGTGQEETDSAIDALETASSQGHWVLLHNAHLNPDLLSRLPMLLHQLPARDKWKVWLSVQGDCPHIPSALLHSANKVVLDPPKALTSSVLYCLHSLAGEIVTTSSRIEWLPILHSMAMLHTTVCLRKDIYPHSWTTDLSWSYTHFMDAILHMRKDFLNSEENAHSNSGVKPVCWTGIRYMITEVIYGAATTDPTSASILAALTDYWIHTGGPKKEAGRYHIPGLFFTPGTRLSGLLQAVENASPPLVQTAELCGLYYSPMIKLGWKDYLFPKLVYLSKYLQGLSVPDPSPTPSVLQRVESADGASLVSMPKTLKGVLAKGGSLVIVERLPSFIPIVSQLTELNLSSIPASLLDSISSNPTLLRELPLRTNVEKLLEKMPSVWKKEVIQERLKKHGVDTPFGVFMKSEVFRMSKCLQAIIDDLKSLHSALCSSTGDVLLESPQLVHLSISLLTLTVPQPWLALVGPSAPPGVWPLREWLQDLVLRFSFFDRVLAGGLAKTATYWLGAFFSPAAFLSMIQQTVVRLSCTRSGATEQFVFHAELTNRDKDHIRDPPPEGEIFVYGAYIWGCSYEKSTNTDFQDIPPKQVPVLLPVLHLSASVVRSLSIEQISQPTALTVEVKGPQTFHCPCFVSNSMWSGRRREDGGKGMQENGGQVLFTMSLVNSDASATAKWTTRNLACTLRPF